MKSLFITPPQKKQATSATCASTLKQVKKKKKKVEMFKRSNIEGQEGSQITVTTMRETNIERKHFSSKIDRRSPKKKQIL